MGRLGLCGGKVSTTKASNWGLKGLG